MDILIVLIAVLAAFYFILMKPVINQQKRQRRDISSLEVGDEVLTTAGFYATVTEINTYEDGPMEIMLEVAPGVVLRGTTLAIQEVSRRASEHGPEDGEDDGDGPGDRDDDEHAERPSNTSSSSRTG
ncbi:MAG: preprotein translocase subunit YajC [Chloroflexi bacterium]|nr:preprotein translocase subunit YajC [Chloroflexota bacterium]MQC18308.1 preprotein translocase subunit YajC [Chloroflexota bacterium]